MMRAPIHAIWPPLMLFGVDFTAFLVSSAIGWWPVAIVAGIASVIMLFDARARTLDYHYARRLFSFSRNPERIATIFQTSWCGRVACEVAARSVDADTGDAVREFYRQSGYRWFHIFPDGTFARKSTFLEPFFWRVTLLGHERARGRVPEKRRNVSRLADQKNQTVTPMPLRRAA